MEGIEEVVGRNVNAERWWWSEGGFERTWDRCGDERSLDGKHALMYNRL